MRHLSAVALGAPPTALGSLTLTDPAQRPRGGWLRSLRDKPAQRLRALMLLQSIRQTNRQGCHVAKVDPLDFHVAGSVLPSRVAEVHLRERWREGSPSPKA